LRSGTKSRSGCARREEWRQIKKQEQAERAPRLRLAEAEVDEDYRDWQRHVATLEVETAAPRSPTASLRC